ncbi:MAG: two pore domain potassium channel family protein [Lewinellaceae bacterium]|nr:two pore domain potassium channel family protein [Saprospiraceae bacterium]MCB9340975.1 two pore domain potassium channel family protein [Lewinellaceae bacterium]
MKQALPFLRRRKYEVLLFALVQHLFIGIFLRDLPFYTKYIWVANMLILGVASVGVFVEKGRWKNVVKNLLFVLVTAFPLAVPFVQHVPEFMYALNISYVLFFSFIFWEVLKFLLRPGYINLDIISASACGYFLLIEISVFLMQMLFYQNPDSFKGVSNTGDPASTYIDLVYFCSITLTSIGFGDILPNAHYTKLATAFFGIAGQFYSVVLVGILISKFTSNSTT